MQSVSARQSNVHDVPLQYVPALHCASVVHGSWTGCAPSMHTIIVVPLVAAAQ